MADDKKEEYETEILEIQQELTLTSKEDGILPSRNYRSTLSRFGYTFHETIGEGAFAKVKRAYCRKLNKIVAVKIIFKTKIPEDVRDKFLPREIALLQKLRHSSLMVLHEVYESRANIYLVMEYLANGDLLDYVNKVGSLSEVDARRLFHQLLDVLCYLHEQFVFHRDIKLDNILLDKFFNIRLTDFGFARFNPKLTQMATFCGSYAYAPPEIIDGEAYSGDAVDIWSTGVCLYGMLNGKLPFRDDDVDILRNSMNEGIEFHKQLSEDAQELICSILTVDRTKRPSIPTIRKSVWMCKPITNTNDESMSHKSATSVASVQPEVNLNAEHGFSCAQNSKPSTLKLVTDVLRSVAANHSTGSSSIDLKEVFVKKAASSAAVLTGVQGPVGRKLSVHMGMLGIGGDVRTKAKSLLQVPAVRKNSGTSKIKYLQRLFTEDRTQDTLKDKKAVTFQQSDKVTNNFRKAVHAVTALRRFRRSPLTTILTIPQNEAMKKVIITRETDNMKDLQDVRRTFSGKVAKLLRDRRQEESSARRASLQLADDIKKREIEKLRRWSDTVTHLVAQ